jgi:hypothetical protein
MSGSIGMRSVPNIHGRLLPAAGRARLRHRLRALKTWWPACGRWTIKPLPSSCGYFTTSCGPKKKSPMAALREAQLWILNNPNQIPALAAARGANFDKVVQLPSGGKRVDVRNKSGPFLWAGFVISGAGQ